MYRTRVLHGLVSTRHGQRRILKKKSSVSQYIRQAIDSGSYPPNSDEPEHPNKPHGTNFRSYPIEHEILTLFPPIPPPPRIPKKFRKVRLTESSLLPTDLLVKEYLKRHQHDDGMSEEVYYNALLGIPPPKLTTAMGRKGALVNKAYAFALKQFEIMRNDDTITEQETIQMVEDLLAEEKKKEQFTSRIHANQMQEWRLREENKQERGTTTSSSFAKRIEASRRPPSTFKNQDRLSGDGGDESTAPSILHNKPRTIEGMAIWSARLKAVPYREWTIGATSALDHWIARSILGLEEDTWQELLEGNNPELMAHGRDILSVRQSLFPETNIRNQQQQQAEQEHALADASTPKSDYDDSEDKSIDELLATLGGFDGDDDFGREQSMKPSFEDDGDMDQKVALLVQGLQDWRAKHVHSPYDDWSMKEKNEFTLWLDKYVTTLASKREGEIDMVATRKALLASPPIDKEESDKFWNQVRDETEAEILLQSLRKAGAPSPEGKTGAERKAHDAFALFQDLPYDVQLKKLVGLGTLRPMLDEYTSESERIKFLARYGEQLMEGVEMEHLVPHPEGTIVGKELGRWGVDNGIGPEERFRMEMVAYGSDEFGKSRNERARDMYQAWNTHKAGRARFEETMFKKGRLGLRYDLDAKKKKKRFE